MPKVSFIVPCYNSGHLIDRCFKSLGCQSLTDVEFIFVDDGSTDSTGVIIENYIKFEPRAKLVSQKNQGITAARLTGIKYATADYVTFVDSDDFVDTSVAEDAVRLFDSGEDVDAVLYSLAYLKGESLRYFKYPMTFPISGYDTLSYSIPSWRITTNGFYRREHALIAYSAIDFSSTNSDELAGRLIFENCKQVKRIESLYYYVQYDDSTSKKPSKNYITRLESAFWLRNYSLLKLSGHVSRKDADIHYINELCSLMIRYRLLGHELDGAILSFWSERILIHRRNIRNVLWGAVTSYPFGLLGDIKMIKKIVYILSWPVINWQSPIARVDYR